MKRALLFFAFTFIFQSFSINAQEFQKPSEGKAMVYFLRTSGLGAAMNFKFFDNDKYLGKFSGKNYVKHEVDPGKHLIWAKSENLDFIEADLKPNAIYLIHVKPKMGGLKASVALEPLDLSDTKVMEKTMKLITKKKSVSFNMKKAEKEKAKIKEYMAKYEESKGTDKVKVISADMEYTN